MKIVEEEMDNDSSFPSHRKNKRNFSSNCHSNGKFKSNYINDTDSTQSGKQIQVSILDSQHKHQVLESVSEPRVNHLNHNSNVSSCKKFFKKEYYCKTEDDISKVYHTNISESYSSSTYPLEEILKYKNKNMEDSIQTRKVIVNNKITSSKTLKAQQVKGDSYVGKDHIRLQNNAKEEKNIERCPARYIPSPDPLAIATSQVFSQDYQAMPLESPSNIYEARIYNYSKVKYSPSNKQEKCMFVSQAEESQAVPTRSSSLDSHNPLTFSNNKGEVNEKYGRYSDLNISNCNFNINYHNDEEPQALNLEVPKVCKVASAKLEYSSLQSQENDFETPMSNSTTSNVKKVNEHEIRNNTGTCSLDEKSKYYESGNLLRKIPLCDEKDLLTNEAKINNGDPNIQINLRRSSRVPKQKKYPEGVFGNDFDGSSPGIKMEHAMKNSNDNIGELLECNNCDAMFRNHNSLMRHHTSCHLFTCCMCNWQGSAKTDYEIHMSTQHFKPIDRCLACREEFSSYDLYREHMINVHHKTSLSSYSNSNATVNQPQQTYPKSREYISMQTKLLSDNIKILKDREKEYDGIYQTSFDKSPTEIIERTSQGNKKCPYCPKSFMRQNRLVRHLNYHLGKKSFVCNVCKKSFVEKSGLVAHMVTHNPVNAVCKHCDKVFKTQRTLKRHLQTHKNRTYECDLCNKVFHHMESLRVHKLTHNEGGSGNTCDICNKDCKTPYYLQVHLKTKHESAKFECKDCQKFFKWKQSFTKHRQLFHKDPDNDPSTESIAKNLTSKSKFECDICSRLHSCMSDLLKHQVSHKKEGKHTCDLCGKTFKHAYTRDKHIKMVHDESNEHECPHCRTKFKAKEYLEQHMAHVHTTKDRVKCGHCGNDFKTEANLKSHIKTVHGYKKSKYICKNCKKCFTSPKDLARHQKTHTGVRDFQCPVCQRGFSRKDNMTAHLRTHTEPTTGPTAISGSPASYVISSESQKLSTTNETSPIDTRSSSNVHGPITLTFPGNDITVTSSQTSAAIISQSRIETPSVTTKQYNCSFSSSITSVSTMPHQVITTVSTGLPVGKDKHTSTATCILTVPNASLSSSPIFNTVPTPTSITSSFISLSNGSSVVSPSTALTSSSSSGSPLITLASSNLSSLTSPTVLPVSHLSKNSDSSMEIEVMSDLPEATSHSVLQQDHMVVADGILPLITPTQTHFNEPHVVYTILEDGSSKLESLETLSIHPMSPNSTTGQTEIIVTKHEPLDS